jgi:hypothetical protein
LKFYTDFKAYLVVLDHCEWAVLLRSFASASSVLTFVHDPGNNDDEPFSPALATEAQAFLSETANLNFQRGPLFDVLCRVNEARERTNKIGHLHGDLQKCFDEIFDDTIPTILNHGKARQSLLKEMIACCNALRLTTATTMDALVMDFQDRPEKSGIALACEIVEARAVEKRLKVADFQLITDIGEGDVVLLNKLELCQFAESMLSGIPIASTILDLYLKKPFKEMEESWVEAARPSFRLLEAEEVLGEGIESAKAIVDGLLGSDYTNACSKLVGERLKSGKSPASILLDLPVARISQTLVSVSTALRDDEEVPRFGWMSSVVEGDTSSDDKVALSHSWVEVLTHATQVISMASYLSVKYEVDKHYYYYLLLYTTTIY